MKFTLASVALVLALATPSLGAPIPVSRAACSGSSVDESCRSQFRSLEAQWRAIEQSELTVPPKNPHFPAHQIRPAESKKASETIALERLLIPEYAIQLESPIRNPKLRAVMNAANDDAEATRNHQRGSKWTSITIKTFNVSPPSGASDAERWSRLDANIEYNNLPAAIMRKLEKEVGQLRHKRKKLAPAIAHKDGANARVTTVTYAYTYGYVRRDYHDVLVVSIVLLFLLAVALVEFLEQIIESSKVFFGLDQGAIRLEDGDSKSGEFLPNYTPAMMQDELLESGYDSETMEIFDEKSCLLGA